MLGRPAAPEGNTAAEANRSFSRVFRAVRAGRSYIITAHGLPVARIVRIEDHDHIASEAKQVLLARLAREPATEIGRRTGDEFYEDQH
jgi:prevent-host-death family protein